MTLRDLLAAATPGPWAEGPNGSIVRPGVTRKGDGRPKPCPSRNESVVAVIDFNSGCGDPDCCSQDPDYRVTLLPADRALIVALRNSAEALLNERDLLRRVAECARASLTARGYEPTNESPEDYALFLALEALPREGGA